MKIENTIYAILVVLLGTLPLYVPIMYQTPDDYIYTLIMSGCYTGVPDAHTIFLGYGFSSFVTFLYSSIKGIEWYAVTLHFLMLIAYITFVYFTQRHINDKYIRFSYIISLTLLQGCFIICPQNTLVSIEYSFLAIVVLLYSKRNKTWILAYFVFSIGASIRPMAALIPFMILFPLFFDSFNPFKRTFWKTSAYLSAFFIITISISWHTKIQYEGEGWDYYTKYNSARGYIHDNPIAYIGKKVCCNSIELDEWHLLTESWAPDGTILNADKLYRAKEEISSFKFLSIESSLANYSRVYGNLGLFFILPLILCLMVVSIKRKQLFLANKLLLSFLMFLLASLYMMSFSVAKTRVLYGVVLALLFVSLHHSYILHKYKQSVTIALLLIMSILFIRQTRSSFLWSSQFAKTSDQIEKLVEKVECKRIYIHNYTYTQKPAFYISNSSLSKKLILSGWLTNSPFTTKHYTSLKSLVNNNIPIVINKEAISDIDIMTSLLSKYYKIKTNFKVLEYNSNFEVVLLEKR